MNIPLLQTEKWQKLQQDLGKTTFFEKDNGYQFLAILEKTPFGSYLYCPYGPVAENTKSFKNSLESLKKIAKEQKAFFIRLEPQLKSLEKTLKSTKNFKKSKDLNPKETWVIDLTGSDDELKQRLPSRLLRYYKNAEKNRLIIEKSKNPDDIKHLVKLQSALAKQKKIGTFSADYLKTQLKQPFATLYLLKQDQSVLAAGLVFDDETTRYNLQGAQSADGAKLHATGILTIELIKDAKAKNLNTFDCWGIAPENAPKNHPWAGFTAFKKTFSGKEIDYCGTYDYILSPLKYSAYWLLREINLLVRKIK